MPTIELDSAANTIHVSQNSQELAVRTSESTVSVVERPQDVSISQVEQAVAIEATKRGIQGAQGPQGDQGPQGLQGPQGEPGQDANYVQDFTASSSVTVTHNLGKRPAITVIASSGDVVEGEVEYNDLNTVTVTFSAPFSGRVIAN